MTARTRTPLNHRSVLTVEQLESRVVPATLVNPRTVTFQDVDGDKVSIVLSEPLLTSTNVNGVFTFNTGAVNGSNTLKQQLQKVDFTTLGAAAAGLSISIVADPDPVTNAGDSFVNVGAIISQRPLQNVNVNGDLGRIEAKTTAASPEFTMAVASLTVRSMGQLGTSTQPSAGASLTSTLVGSLGSLEVSADIVNAFLLVQKRASTGPMDPGSSGKITNVSIGGSLKGGTAVNSGRIQADWNIRSVTIGVDVVGGSGDFSGAIVSLEGRIGDVAIKGSLIGADGENSGSLLSLKKITSVRIDEDVDDGRIVSTTGGITSVFIGGSLISGPNAVPGSIQAGNAIKTIEIVGDMIGTFTNPVVISARGRANVPAGSNADVAMETVTIGGKVEFGDFLAGYNTDLLAVNADAQIGTVTVGRDWIATNLVAGARPGSDGRFGTINDIKISGTGVTDQSTIISRIASIVIGGVVKGTTGGTDHYGFVAERVKSLKVGTTFVTLQLGAHNDKGVSVGSPGLSTR